MADASVRRNRSARYSIALLLTAVMVTACATGEDPDANHEEAATELNELYAIAQNAVTENADVGKWQSLDGGAENCTLPSGGTGARYPLRRSGPGLPKENQQIVVDAVVEGWAAAGFEPTVDSVELSTADIFGFTIRFRSPDDSGVLMAFDLRNTASSLDGNTRCVPGDTAEINRKYRELQGR